MNIGQYIISSEMVLSILGVFTLGLAYLSFRIGKTIASSECDKESYLIEDDDKLSTSESSLITPNLKTLWFHKVTATDVNGKLNYIPWIDLEKDSLLVLQSRSKWLLVRYNREDNFNFFIHEDEFLNEFMKDEFNDLPKEEVLPANEPLEEKEEILKVVNSSTETQALEESDDPEASVTGHAKPPKPLPVKEKDELEPIPSHKNIITIDGKNFELTPVS